MKVFQYSPTAFLRLPSFGRKPNASLKERHAALSNLSTYPERYEAVRALIAKLTNWPGGDMLIDLDPRHYQILQKMQLIPQDIISPRIVGTARAEQLDYIV